MVQQRKHVRRSDTKPLPEGAFLYHEWASQGFTRNESDLRRSRCSCYRCPTAWGFAKSRCINFAVDGGRFCGECSVGCEFSDDELDGKAAPCPCRCLDPPWRFGTDKKEEAAATLVALLVIGAGA